MFGILTHYIYRLAQFEPLVVGAERLKKICQCFDNDILFSSFVAYSPLYASMIRDAIGSNRIYLDSGGFTLFREQKKLGERSKIFRARCEKARRAFLKAVELIKPAFTFELDNEYFRQRKDLLSPKNYCRDEVKEITGSYPIPVFKLHQGFAYWKDLCDTDIYPVIAIGGLAQTSEWLKHKDLVDKMMRYARDKHKKVHLMGCSDVNVVRQVKPTTVDYNIFQLAINAHELTRMYPKFKKCAFCDIESLVALLSFARVQSRAFLYEFQEEK